MILSCPSRHILAVTTITLCSLLLSGCSGERDFNRPTTFPVTGKVLVNGEPVKAPLKLIGRATKTNAVVVDEVMQPSGSCFVGEDGVMSFTTFKTGDGLEPGEYKLTFTVSQLNYFNAQYEGDALNGKYADPSQSQFKVTVTGNETEPIVLADIELSTD